jgi:hypothetical protein
LVFFHRPIDLSPENGDDPLPLLPGPDIKDNLRLSGAICSRGNFKLIAAGTSKILV